MRKVCLLGASGSIGSQTLDILLDNPDHFELTGISIGRQVDKIPAILQRFPSVSHLCVREEGDAKKLEKAYPNLKVYHGDDGLLELIASCPCDMVVNALVGFSGLAPSVKSLELDKILCLANKESLVVGGALINDLRNHGKGKLYPIDSEHVAIAKLLSSVNREDVDEIWITASGGSFRDKTREELTSVTPEEALSHPTWSMGAKITIDSATMMNKGFEVIEAKVLFDFPLEKTKILMHRESNVHSLLKMKDGTFIGDVSVPDMHGPIAYALFEGQVDFSLSRGKDLKDFGPFHFGLFNEKRYPCVGLALQAFQRGGLFGAVLNAANEIAVYAFLDKKIPFLVIEEEVRYALEHFPCQGQVDLASLIKTDHEVRDFVTDHIERRRRKANVV